MFDVFTEEIEVLIKDGIANLYWYKGDLQKAWTRSGVPNRLILEVVALIDLEGRSLSKRKQMDALYERLRTAEFDRRLEVSRNFVRILVEQNGFSRQDDRHRIEVAERAALKLKDLIRIQEKQVNSRESGRAKTPDPAVTYELQLAALRVKFLAANSLEPQKKGYALEEIFNDLMRISNIEVYQPFKINGEQFDGAIKHEGHHYLIELKWTANSVAPIDVNHFYMKVLGKMEARGLLISMAGFTPGVLDTLPKGKDLKLLLFNGLHIANVIFGQYDFAKLLNRAIGEASLRGNIYCDGDLSS